MKAVTFGALTACIGAVAVIAACGGSSPAPAGGSNAFATQGNNSGSTSQSGGGFCNAMCQADSDCAMNCPGAPAGSSNCCDTAAGVCVLATGTTCPVPKNGNGGSDNSVGPSSGSGGGNSSGGGGSSSGGGGMCPSMCMQDSDCQNACPAAPNNGTNCCDTTMGMCFVATSSTCPVPDAGTMGD